MTMVSVRTMNILTTALVICLFFCELCHSQGSPRRRQRNRNTPRPNQAVLPNGLQSAYHAAFNQQVSTPAFPSMSPAHGPLPNHGQPQDAPQAISSRTDWNRFTPSTPASNNVECYVTRSFVRLLGGRCTRLGGTIQPYICQSGVHFDFNEDCAYILEERENSGS